MLSTSSMFHDLSSLHAPELQHVFVSHRVKIFAAKNMAFCWNRFNTYLEKKKLIICRSRQKIAFKTYACKGTAFWLMLFSVEPMVLFCSALRNITKSFQVMSLRIANVLRICLDMPSKSISVVTKIFSKNAYEKNLWLNTWVWTHSVSFSIYPEWRTYCWNLIVY